MHEIGVFKSDVGSSSPIDHSKFLAQSCGFIFVYLLPVWLSLLRGLSAYLSLQGKNLMHCEMGAFLSPFSVVSSAFAALVVQKTAR
jgi:hypothetical protein